MTERSCEMILPPGWCVALYLSIGERSVSGRRLVRMVERVFEEYCKIEDQVSSNE